MYNLSNHLVPKCIVLYTNNQLCFNTSLTTLIITPPQEYNIRIKNYPSYICVVNKLSDYSSEIAHYLTNWVNKYYKWCSYMYRCLRKSKVHLWLCRSLPLQNSPICHFLTTIRPMQEIWVATYVGSYQSPSWAYGVVV